MIAFHVRGYEQPTTAITKRRNAMTPHTSGLFCLILAPNLVVPFLERRCR
eukprot:m.191778 g.191778  ORF g.191778 m.191778 type:complete len:50 (+) comp32444_c0_seq10:123-272(+)